MQEAEYEIYKKLQNHLDKQPIGYPATESGIELRVLRHLFSPEEAKIASEMNYIPEPVKKIYRKFKTKYKNPEELEEKLDIMIKKGSIARVELEGEKHYSNAPFIVGMFEYQLGRLTKEFLVDAKQYLEEDFFEKGYNKTAVPQLRVVPVEVSIKKEQSISTYDELRNIIESSEGTIGIMECICRQGKDLLGDPCKKSDLREVCFTFRRTAEMQEEKGLAKLISKEEAFSILKKVEEAGFVLQPDNSLRPAYMCCCCGCCCEVLTNQKRFDAPAKLFATNFYAEVDPDLCIGCGVCEERCNLEAITIEDDLSNIDLKYCIGCGVCVPTCTQEAITLQKKEEEILPPRNTGAKMKIIMDKKAESARLKKN